jgi:PAS domain S-box-containing protein
VFKVFLCIATQHNWWLVVLAATVCVLATLATFYLYSKVPPFPAWKRWAWIGMTGLVAGSGIWTTHFVAMLAFKTGLPTGYAALETMGSLAIAVLSTGGGFALGSSPFVGERRGLAALGGGLAVGLGITYMHYVGMSGYRTAGHLVWDPQYVAGSVLIGAVLGAAALFVGAGGGGLRRRFAASGLLSLGIVGMHFTGMAAVTITPDASIAVPASLMSSALMVVAAVAVTAIILITAIGGVAFDAASRNGNLRRLREALDVMPEGLAFYDAFDRLLVWNSRYEELCLADRVKPHVGMKFADLLETSLVHGARPAAMGREREWVAQRTGARAVDLPSFTEETADGRWLRITERRTGDGGTVSVSVDITELKQTEGAMAEALDRAEELARRAEVAESIAGLGRWRLDTGSLDLSWSPQMCRIYGMEPGATLDFDTVMAMTHPDDLSAVTERMKRQMASGEPDEGSITRIVRANGQTRYLSAHSGVERRETGEIYAVIGTVVDITEQVMAERAVAASEERFRRLAVNAPDMITESDLSGVLTYVSPASAAITGFTPEDLVGRSAFSVMGDDDARKVRAMCQAAIASKGLLAAYPVEFQARHKSGEMLWLECKPTLAVDPVSGRFTGFNDVVRDVTARKILEADLRTARAEAEDAASVKAEFLANMSHELRTPLTSILGFTSLAAEQTDLSPLSRTYIERVGNASQALLCTVNDILDFSKLEAGQVSIHPQPVDFAKLSGAALDLFTPQAGAKDLSLALLGDATGGLVLSLDPDRMRQVLLNLVSNAVKFTRQGGVTLTTRYDHEASRLRVEVADTGDGIAPEKLELLFKRFSQVDGSLTRAQGGTGLGLAICKGLIEAMGGEIGVDSQPGAGTRFWFSVPAPLATLPDVSDEDGAPERPTFAGVRVLVVDDHATNRELARLFLAGVGAEVFEAVDGEDAAQQAAEWPFDVILMDLRMPRLDGLGALRKIRAAPGPNDATPVLAFSADASETLAAELMASGFEGLVSKPVEPGALIAAVASATAFVGAALAEDIAHAG